MAVLSSLWGIGSTTLPLLALALAVVIFRYVLYPALFSPLSKIPSAHPLAPWTPLWILRVRFQGCENTTLYESHKRLGPVVRLGPNEVSVNNYEDGLRPIYNGNFDKHQWYANIFSNYRIPNTFCLTDGKQHHERKRLFTNIFSKSYIQGSKDMSDITRELLLNRIMPTFQAASVTKEPIEMMEFSAAIGMDFTCAYIFGLDAGSDFIRDTTYRKYWLDAYEDTKKYFTWVAELILPVILLKMVGVNILPDSVFKTIDNMGEWNLRMCKNAQEARVSGQSAGSTRSLVYDQMVGGLEKVDNPPHPKDMIVASEMLDQILAGHETTAITLTYLIYEVSRRPELQRRLREEVRTLSPRLDCPSRSSEVPHPRGLDALPLLDAVIQETLRRYPAASGAEHRVTPKAGASIGPYHVPGGVRIHCNQYSLHRNEEAFPDPESWRPERWATASKEQKTEMNKYFWAFGSGARMCLGMHFALQELKYVVSAIYTNYETSIPAGGEGDMEPLQGFVGRPKGNRLMVDFKRVE